MSAFTVEFENQPGRLAELCDVMAARGVNLVICGVTNGNTGTVAFIADDEAAARTALQDGGFDARERESLTVRLRNAPGVGAATFRKLADAGVNVEVFLPVRVSDSQFVGVLCVDDQAAARNVLGNVIG